MDMTRHPCFNDAVRHQYGRVHLPVAPKCNIQCNFCDRQFDCVNESRPGVTSVVLSPGQALHYLKGVIARDPRIAVVGIAGPGDPFANADETMETLRLVRREYPDMLLCVASNGLNVTPYAAGLAALDVGHVTITLNAVDPVIGGKIYSWVRLGPRVYRGVEAGKVLLDRQLEAIEALKQRKVTVKINTILIDGINDNHVEAVASKVADLGVDILNIIPMYPVANTAFEQLLSPGAETVAKARETGGQYVKQMHHCTRCRADACGLLGEDEIERIQAEMLAASRLPLNPDEHRPCIAVASNEGVLVNQHLGEAERLWIFRETNGEFVNEGTRNAPPPGGGMGRWEALGDLLHDCRALVCSAAGETPISALKESGVQVVLTDGLIDEAIDAVVTGRKLPPPMQPGKCGSGCRGTGTGCG